MKAVLKFLLNTGFGREITRAIIAFAIRLFKDKVLSKMEPYKRDNMKAVLDLAHQELDADIDKAKPTDLI